MPKERGLVSNPMNGSDHKMTRVRVNKTILFVGINPMNGSEHGIMGTITWKEYLNPRGFEHVILNFKGGGCT